MIFSNFALLHFFLVFLNFFNIFLLILFFQFFSKIFCFLFLFFFKLFTFLCFFSNSFCCACFFELYCLFVAVVRPYMFQVGMSYDVVPKVSSWVLYGLGPASRYRHNYGSAFKFLTAPNDFDDVWRVFPIGLEHHLQADFLNLYHHLLPVDAEILLSRAHRLVKHLPNRPAQVQIGKCQSSRNYTLARNLNSFFHCLRDQKWIVSDDVCTRC